MNRCSWMLALFTLALSGCGRGGTSTESPDKAVGPDPRTLTHDQLLAIFQECHAYGPIDDPRVKYSMAYCASVETAHASEGWTTPSTAPVDQKLNALH